MYFVLYRGGQFRASFDQLGQVRSLVPSHVNIMALTAMAEKNTKTEVCATLGMYCPNIKLIM